ncbi:hypothetical protein CRG98_028270 [Punica granatum]|uniref:Uncharacterized protein n=1 Tax=Punica granatum TaxID=22663 RepID=A0A2I0J5I6_PUNGR|nr:hypothetical protein CRG98_028270 [Punica granatum]
MTSPHYPEPAPTSGKTVQKDVYLLTFPLALGISTAVRPSIPTSGERTKEMAVILSESGDASSAPAPHDDLGLWLLYSSPTLYICCYVFGLL